MTRRLPALKPKVVLKALQRTGFCIHHTTGSHYILKHLQNETLRITLPYHTRDLKRDTLRSIIKQADITEEAFLKLL